MPPTSPLSLPPALPVPLTPEMRAFGDTAGVRQRIFDNTLAGAQAIQPVSNARFSLAMENPQYVGAEAYDPEAQKRAIIEGRSLTRRLQGEWVLRDTAGTELSRKRTTLARVPYYTDMGKFIYNGNAYPIGNQMRLQPGVYARRKENGELESHVNVAKGRAHRLSMDPDTGIFKLNIAQASIPLTPLLQAMGASREQLHEAWGPELAAANLGKSDAKAIDKLYAKLLGDAGSPAADHLAKAAAVVQTFQDMTLDPLITKRTLGQPFSNLSAEALLAATKKLVQINNNETDPDDRDSPIYQKVLGPEDLFTEKMKLAPNLMRRMLWKATSQGNLDRVSPGAFDDLLQGIILHSGLASAAEEINPGELFDHQSRVTRMGEGGIPSIDSVPDESRAVQPAHLGFIDILRTPESARVGVDLRFARATRKGVDGRIYTPVKNLETGQLEYKSPQDLADETLVFPGEDVASGYVRAMRGGKISTLPAAGLKYQLPEMEDTFSPLGNLIPNKSSLKGQRAVMAARMLTQALPLTDPEAPLVQSGLPENPDRSFDEEYAKHFGAIHATVASRVESVTPEKIVLSGQDGKTTEMPLYRNFPYNRKTMFHQTPTVKPGDVVQPGQLLATSNYTDQKGTIALGKNVRVAYIPWGGHNFEDANVVSESLAKRMTSEHMYQHGYEWDPQTRRGRDSFVGIFPAAYDKKILANFDHQGVVKPGTVVNYGDPLILAAREREINHKSMLKSRPSFHNESVVWEHQSPGEVTDISVNDKGVNVVVKANTQLQVGDKLSGRHGDKGIVAKIIPDAEMPHDAQGRPFEALLNPLGVISRVNPAQIIEAALGKVAAARGKPYKIQDFKNTPDMVEYALAELRKAGLSDTEDIYDPKTGRKIPDIFTGNRWYMKLHHTAESKQQGRGFGAYTAEGLPAKGGEEGSKRIGMLELSSLLSHGATQVIRDAHLIRGQANPQFWSQYMAGYNPETPKVPRQYEKFFNQLRASGINPLRDGPRTHIMALTNKNVTELAGDREIQNAETVNWKTMQPVPGGLFDPKLTGGHASSTGGGNRWSRITLHEPLPNPVMEEPIRKVLGLTEPKFLAILAGKDEFHGRKGPVAITEALNRIDLDKEISLTRKEIASGKKTRRDIAVRKLGYLRDAKRLDVHPRDWVLDSIPVLPPAFRPVSTMGKAKLPLVDDANYLYKEAFDANQNLKELSGLVDDVSEERTTLYNAFKAVTGMGEPTHPKNQERQVKGVLKHVFGNSPKQSSIHRKLLGAQVDRVGRAVIAPDPDLDMDSVGLPENAAWAIYRPDIVRRLVRGGMDGRTALRAVEERSPAARASLQKEVDDGVIVYNRAPTLHRYGILAAKPKLTKGTVLTVSPLMVKGATADFDGDALQFHALTTPEEKQEALDKMLPSRNLFSVAKFDRPQYMPTQEYVGGLYEASARIAKDKPPLVFATAADAMRAYTAGEIGVDRRVEIVNH